MSSCSGFGGYGGGERGRSRYRRNSDAASEMASLPPSGYGMGLSHRQRQGSVSSLLSNRSGKDLIFGLEEFEAQNKIDLDHERAEAAVSQHLSLSISVCSADDLAVSQIAKADFDLPLLQIWLFIFHLPDKHFQSDNPHFPLFCLSISVLEFV